MEGKPDWLPGFPVQIYCNRKVFSMQAQNFMRVEEVAQELGISKSHAYKVIHKLNAELRDKGYLTISGRVNRNFFMEKFCYGKTEKEG